MKIRGEKVSTRGKETSTVPLIQKYSRGWTDRKGVQKKMMFRTGKGRALIETTKIVEFGAKLMKRAAPEVWVQVNALEVGDHHTKKKTE